jgi:hypothetical protein
MLNPKVMAYLNIGIENARFQFTYLFNKQRLQQCLRNKLLAITSALSPALGATYKMSSPTLGINYHRHSLAV